MAVLVIRTEQMRTLEEAQENRFVRYLAAHLRLTIGDNLKKLNDEDSLATARFCCKSAHRYGIEIEDDVRRFAEFVIKYGRGMDEDQRYPWIGQVLTREGISGADKMNILDHLELQFIGIAP